MEIFLLILKIIGIVLLAILGLILFVLLVVLITPIRYRLTGTYKDDKPDVLLNIHFWFHLISAKVTYTKEGIGANLRIFFIKKTIKTPNKKASEEKPELSDMELIQQAIDSMEEETENDTPDKTDETLSEQNQTVVEEKTEELKENESDNKQEDEINAETKPEEKAEGDAEAEPVNETENKTETEEGQKTLFDKIAGKITDKIKGLYTKVTDKYQNIIKKKTAAEWLLSQESTQRILKVSWKQLIKTLKSIMPRRFKGYLNLGLEDPRTMGMICTYSSVIYPSFPKNFEFKPIFGEKIIDANIDTKGRIILGAVLGHLLKIVIRRDFFRTLKNLKRFKRMWR